MKKQKQVYQVYCTNPSHGSLHFFLKTHVGDIFLFATYYSNSIYQDYREGVRAENVYRNTKNRRKQRVKEHIRRNVNYTARTYDLALTM